MSTESPSGKPNKNRNQRYIDQITKDIDELRRNPKSVRFDELAKICNRHFGNPRHNATSHHNYKVPWPGRPQVNIQNQKGMAKPFQVRQVIKALEKLREIQ